MASLWIQTKSAKEPTKLIGRLSPETARAQLAAMALRYVQEKAGRSVRKISAEDAILHDSKGRPWANVWVELLSPPSEPEPGEKRRTVKQGGA